MTATTTTEDPGARYWCARDPFRTRFYEAMSLVAPEAERFFIRAMRANLPALPAGALRERCQRFIREEGEHSRMHHALNHRLDRQGIDTAALVRPLRRLGDWAHARFTPRFTLALTAAGEHLSAIMSDLFLRGDHARAFADPAIRDLYVWHAREELGHRAVAHELLCALGGQTWLLRVAAMLALTLVSPLLILGVIQGLLRADAPRSRLGAWLGGLPWLLGVGQPGPGPGLLLRNYLQYFRPRFDPNRVPAAV